MLSTTSSLIPSLVVSRMVGNRTEKNISTTHGAQDLKSIGTQPSILSAQATHTLMLTLLHPLSNSGRLTTNTLSTRVSLRILTIRPVSDSTELSTLMRTNGSGLESTILLSSMNSSTMALSRVTSSSSPAES
jgi:hypothetical protein